LRENYNDSEATLLARFKQSAAMLAERIPTTSFDWTFLMQHYGVPTRLLDWTESPLIALYFAVEKWDEHPDCEAAVWCLKPTELNKFARLIDKNEPRYIPSFDDDELKNYSLESLRGARVELFPAATIATRNNARIQAQVGVFTIHHNHPIPIDEIGDGSHVIKYAIPKESREAILKELRLLGLTRLSLFPELASVGSFIKEMMR